MAMAAASTRWTRSPCGSSWMISRVSWRICVPSRANERRRLELSPRSSGQTGASWTSSWRTGRNNPPQLHHRTDSPPVKLQVRNALVENPLGRIAKAPLRSVLVQHGAVPSNVTPRRVRRTIAIRVPMCVQRAAADVKNGSADVDERHAAGVRLHAEVSVHMDLRVAVDLVEPARLVICLPIEQQKVARRIGEPRGLDVIHLFPVPFVVQDVPVERRGIARSEERRVGKECRSRWWPDN